MAGQMGKSGSAAVSGITSAGCCAHRKLNARLRKSSSGTASSEKGRLAMLRRMMLTLDWPLAVSPWLPQKILKRFSFQMHFILEAKLCPRDALEMINLSWKGLMRKIITFKQQTKAMLLGLLMLIPGRSHSQGPAQIKIFKISVLASGTVLLDGKQIEMKDLDVALSNTGSAGGAVLYYRELSADEPPPQAKEVISLIIKHRLPVRLCTKPDFSD